MENEALQSNIRELQSKITALHKQLDDNKYKQQFDPTTIGVRRAFYILWGSLVRRFKKTISKIV
jgi:hypothetical protein